MFHNFATNHNFAGLNTTLESFNKIDRKVCVGRVYEYNYIFARLCSDFLDLVTWPLVTSEQSLSCNISEYERPASRPTVVTFLPGLRLFNDFDQFIYDSFFVG